MTSRSVGHLLELPLTSGKCALVDPAEICEVGTPHGQEGVTLVRCTGQRFAHYVDAEYPAVRLWIDAALRAP